MNKKITIILALLFLAIISVSIVTAVNDTLDSTAASDDSDDAISEDSNPDKVSEDDNDKLSAKDDDDVEGDPSDAGPAEFTIKKVWDDNNDKAGKRPKSVSVSAIVDGDTRGPFELSEENGWQATVVDVAGATSIEIKEEAVDGYKTTVTGSPSEGYTITNTLEDDGQNGTDPTDSDDTTGSDDKSVSDDVDPDGNKNPEVKKQTTTITKTTTKEVPVKKQAKNDEPKKAKDKHDTGNPVLLGVLAISVAGLAYSLRRRE